MGLSPTNWGINPNKSDKTQRGGIWNGGQDRANAPPLTCPENRSLCPFDTIQRITSESEPESRLCLGRVGMRLA